MFSIILTFAGLYAITQASKNNEQTNHVPKEYEQTNPTLRDATANIFKTELERREVPRYQPERQDFGKSLPQIELSKSDAEKLQIQYADSLDSSIWPTMPRNLNWNPEIYHNRLGFSPHPGLTRYERNPPPKADQQSSMLPPNPNPHKDVIVAKYINEVNRSYKQ